MRLALILVVLAACGRRSSDDGDEIEKQYADGTERGDCYGNGTCNDGLVCMSNLCVRPPGADCDAVVKHLGALLLDNYTPKPERDRFATETLAECVDAKLSQADGQCLLDAKHRNLLSKCPRVIGVGDCASIVLYVRTLPGNDLDLKTDADRVADRCRNEVPSKAFEACALSARHVNELSRCVW